eukprot:UN28891
MNEENGKHPILSSRIFPPPPPSLYSEQKPIMSTLKYSKRAAAQMAAEKITKMQELDMPNLSDASGDEDNSGLYVQKYSEHVKIKEEPAMILKPIMSMKEEPRTNTSSRSRKFWTKEEEELLLKLVDKHKTDGKCDWDGVLMGNRLVGRTKEGVRQHYKLLMRRKNGGNSTP